MVQAIMKPDLSELGGTGTKITAGAIEPDEYVLDLQNESLFDTLDKMRTDPDIAMAFRKFEISIKRAKKRIQPASTKKVDVDIADEVADDLFNMSVTWSEFIHHCMLAVFYGHYSFEKCWIVAEDEVEIAKTTGEGKTERVKEKRTRIRLRKLAARDPKTITEWDVERNGDLLGITQQITLPDGKLENPYMPIEKLLHLVWDKEGANHKGRSIFRPAYRPWKLKDMIERFMASHYDRFGVGIPTATLGENAGPRDQNRAERALKSLRSHGKMYLVGPYGTTFGMLQNPSRALDFVAVLNYLQHQIARTVFAALLMLGEKDVGSWALAETQAGVNSELAQEIADWICDYINRYVIPQLVDYNHADVTSYPSLEIYDLKPIDIKSLAESLGVLTDKGLLTPDPDIEQHLRSILEVPDLPKEIRLWGEAELKELEAKAKKKIEDVKAGKIKEPPSPTPPPPPNDDQETEGQGDQETDEEDEQGNKREDGEGEEEKKKMLDVHRSTFDVRRKQAAFTRPLRETELRIFKAHEVVKGLDMREEQLGRDVKAFQFSLFEKMADAAVKGGDPEKAVKVELKNFTKLAQAKTIEAFEYGQERVRQEILVQGGQPARAMSSGLRSQVSGLRSKAADDFEFDPDEELRRSIENLRAKAVLQVEIVVKKVKDAAKDAALKAEGIVGLDELAQKIEHVVSELHKISELQPADAMRQLIRQGHGAGREWELGANASEIAYEEYSAIMDYAACESCASKDGHEHEHGDAYYQTPNPECEGGARCRCVNIPALKGGILKG